MECGINVFCSGSASVNTVHKVHTVGRVGQPFKECRLDEKVQDFFESRKHVRQKLIQRPSVHVELLRMWWL